MKRLILITLLLLGSISTIAQTPATSEGRKLYADNLELLMNELGFNIEITAGSTENLILTFSYAELNSYLNVAIFIQTTGLNIFEVIFKDMGFLFLCFKEIDKCYTWAEMKIISGI